MRMLDLCSGIGGFSLPAEILGIETVAFCEIDDECLRVLNKHWPKTPKHKDIKTLKGDEYGKIDIITGGYPCQPFSVAGNQKAQEDDRHIWPELFRIVKQCRPTWCVFENVLGHIKLGLDEVLNDLESQGYSTTALNIPALAGGANHNRGRVFVVAHSPSNGRNASKESGSDGKANEYSEKREEENSNNERLSCLRFGVEWEGNPQWRRGAKPPPLRVDDELPRRMDRNRMLGNSVDPKIVYEILKVIVNL